MKKHLIAFLKIFVSMISGIAGLIITISCFYLLLKMGIDLGKIIYTLIL